MLMFYGTVLIWESWGHSEALIILRFRIFDGVILAMIMNIIQGDGVAGSNDAFSVLTDTINIQGESFPDETLLFGRQEEKSLIQSTFGRVQDTHSAEVIVVHGCSGVGKTALVDSVRSFVVCESNGYFCSGKFFQNAGLREPYSAIMAAFSDLCDLVTQSPDFTEQRKNDIRESLGSDVYLLERAISNLSPFIDGVRQEDALACATRSDVAFRKFKVACKTFLHAMSSNENPIVLFIDDIQWMDEGSKQLIQMFLRDEELSNVMLILSYREEETQLIEDLIADDLESRAGVVDIAVQNLDLEAVTQLVKAILDSRSDDDITALCELVEHKTKGNSFHVIQLVDAIQREGLLTLSSDKSRWEFDIDDIQRTVMVSDSLADLLVHQVQRLPLRVQEMLKIAALIGYTFREDILLQVTQRVATATHLDELEEQPNPLPSSSKSSLEVAVECGFIEKIGSGHFFSHDKLQAVFQMMFTTTEEKERIHLFIGEVFLARGDMAESKYQAALHLNLAADLYACDAGGRTKLAFLNRDVAQLCRNKSAFDESAAFLRQGLDLLGPGETKWVQHFDVAFEMTECLATTELIIGNYENCKDATRDALDHVHANEMKVIPLMVDVDRHMVGNDVDGVVSAGNRALGLLGFKMPRKVSFRHLLFKLVKVRRRIRRKTDTEILKLERMQNPSIETAIRILISQCLFCFLRDAGLQAMYCALFATELTLNFGLAPYSASAFAVYGISEVSFGNHSRGYRIGKVALKMLEEVRCRDAEGSTTAIALTLLTHWQDPLHEMPGILTRAATHSFAVGDIFYGTYCVSADFLVSITLGKNLKDLATTMHIACRPIKELGHDDMGRWVMPAMQFVENLRSQGNDWMNKVTLRGGMMDEIEFEAYAVETNHPVFLEIAWQYKAMLAYWFGYWNLCESIYKDMAAMNTALHLTISYLPLCFFAGMASVAMFRETGKRQHLSIARKYRKKLHHVVSMGSRHSAAFLSLLQAEYQSVRKSQLTPTVLASYCRAIHDTSSQQLVHLEALANERLAFFYATQEEHTEAKKHFERAMHLYESGWGASAKTKWVLERSREELEQMSISEVRCSGATPHLGEVIELRIPPITSQL